MTDDFRSHRGPTRITLMHSLQNEENYNSISWERTSFVCISIPMSLPELVFRDESLMVLSLNCFHYLTLVHMQNVWALIFFVSRHRCPNEFMYNDSFAQMIVCKVRKVSPVSLLGRCLTMSLSHPQQRKLPIKEQQNNDYDIPITIQNMACLSQVISYTTAGGISKAASSLSGRCSSTTKCNNNPLPPDVSLKMAPFSMSDDSPPVLRLFKKPVAVNFPAVMSCVISPRPVRSDVRTTVN